jgi:hypothetical protein
MLGLFSFTNRNLNLDKRDIDFVVGEVKGGPESLKFNSAFRDDPQSIRSVLCRFGAFTDAQIDRVCATLPEMLQPARLNRSAAFPELDVPLWEQLGTQTAKLRFVLFATEQRRPSNNARPYIFEDDLLSFVWDCFRPEKHRMQ